LNVTYLSCACRPAEGERKEPWRVFGKELLSYPAELQFESKKREVFLLAKLHALSMHLSIEPSILYLGTPVVLVSTLNEDQSINVAPMSSAWWLGWNCMLGLGSSSQTARNLIREGECVLNLPSVEQVDAVDRLAKLTAADPVPPHKVAMGYRHARNKLERSGLSASKADLVKALRIEECPIQLEAVLENTHPFGNGPGQLAGCWAFEVRIIRAHVEEQLIADGTSDHVDPDRWRPLIMSFCRFYGLSEEVHGSTLAEIPEQAYRPAISMTK
jgi:flavin reductase (DIM6/NTAB) family NADH-FMN oxidoreductase RutF